MREGWLAFAMALVAGGCVVAPDGELMSAEDLSFLRYEYAQCFTLEDVEELRGFYLASFADEELAERDGQFTDWWEEQIERVFGPKPEPGGHCEVHGLALSVGIARTSFGLRLNPITYVQDFDVEERLQKMDPATLAERIQAFEAMPPRPRTPHLRLGAELGCRMTSAYSWAEYWQ